MNRAALLASLLSLTASAQDTWTEPFPGVRHLHRVVPGQNINVAVVDLCRAGVSMRVTASGERQQRPSSFGASVGAQVAINGDFFEYGTYQPDGFAVHDGVQWPGTVDHSYVGQLWFGDERAGIVHHQEVISAAPFMREVIGGHPTLLHDGVELDNTGDTGLCAQRHPRTAVGLSKDRRTLYLAVVDGRASSRLGLTCAELGTLLKDLGAWRALALDGGGSSAMWMEGRGVLNYPSDGTERVTANHLAVYASGQGDAPHCERNVEEVLYQLPVHLAESSSDVDGDGTADACLRGRDGISCATSSGTAFGAAFQGPALTDAAQWWWPVYSQALRTGDFTGDGKADVCARFDDGVHCWASTGAGFGPDLGGPPLSNASGWGELEFNTTLALVDVTGDGKADLCARASERLVCFPSTGAGFGAALEGPALPSSAGWGDLSRYGTVRYGDVNGDGKADVCARDDIFMKCWLSTGTGFGAEVQGPAWPTAYGFGDAKYWSTIRLADVNGDGKDDLCVRTAVDFRCHLSTGTGFGEAIIGPPLIDAFFSRHRYYSTLRLADLDGDGDKDLCVRTGNGLRCWKWTGAGFGTDVLVGPELSDANGWAAMEYYSSLRFADVNADGKADVCARGAAGLHCWLSDGNGFPTRVDGPAWSDAAGFAAIIYGPSLRLSGGGPRCRPVAEVCGNGKDDDCDGQVDEQCALTTTPPEQPEPVDAGVVTGTPPSAEPGPGVTAPSGCASVGGVSGWALLAVCGLSSGARRVRKTQ